MISCKILSKNNTFFNPEAERLTPALLFAFCQPGVRSDSLRLKKVHTHYLTCFRTSSRAAQIQVARDVHIHTHTITNAGLEIAL